MNSPQSDKGSFLHFYYNSVREVKETEYVTTFIIRLFGS